VLSIVRVGGDEYAGTECTRRDAADRVDGNDRRVGRLPDDGAIGGFDWTDGRRELLAFPDGGELNHLRRHLDGSDRNGHRLGEVSTALLLARSREDCKGDDRRNGQNILAIQRTVRFWVICVGEILVGPDGYTSPTPIK
jgi:hypothetical protein